MLSQCILVVVKHVRIEENIRKSVSEEQFPFLVRFSGHPQTHVFLGRNVISLLTLCIHQMRHIFSPVWCAYLRQCCQLPRRDTLMKHFTDLACDAPTCLLRVDTYIYFISLHHWFVAAFISKLNKYFTSLQFVLLAD